MGVRLTTLVAIAFVARPLSAQDTASKSGAPPPPLPSAPSVQIDGFLQLWYLDGHTITNAHDTYRVRRADVKLSGVISPRVRWHISIDGAKLLNLNKTSTVTNDTTVLSDAAVDQRTRILQEASISVSVLPQLRIDVGQQIIPLALEGTIASPQIETIMRTMFIEERSRGGTLGDIRDIGATARGVIGAGSVEYAFGFFNEMGESQNSTDPNDQKAAIGRVAFRLPWINQLEFGGSGGFEAGTLPARRERAGGEAQFRNSWLTLRSEVMGARDGAVRRLGYYGLGALRVTPVIELAARWDDWDPDLHNESGPTTVDERELVGGVNFYIDGGATRLSANIVRSTFPSGLVQTSNELVLALHVVW